jgi:hypothetical protein
MNPAHPMETKKNAERAQKMCPQTSSASENRVKSRKSPKKDSVEEEFQATEEDFQGNQAEKVTKKAKK